MHATDAAEMRPGGEGGLRALEARLAEDLAHLGLPPANWVPPREGVVDAVVVGGGMCGLLAWFALARAGIRNLRVPRPQPRGARGPLDHLRPHGDAALAEAPHGPPRWGWAR